MAKRKLGKNFRQIKDALPNIDNSDLENAANQLDNFQDLAVLADSAGGQYLIQQKIKEANSVLHTIIQKAKVHHEPIELITLILQLDTKLDLIYELSNARENANLQQDLVDQIIEGETSDARFHGN